MNRLVFVILAMLAAGFGLLVGTLNSEAVTLDLLWVQFQWPLGLLLLLSLAVGLLTGLLLSWLTQVLPLRMKLRKSRAETSRAESRDLTGIDG